MWTHGLWMWITFTWIGVPVDCSAAPDSNVTTITTPLDLSLVTTSLSRVEKSQDLKVPPLSEWTLTSHKARSNSEFEPTLDTPSQSGYPNTKLTHETSDFQPAYNTKTATTRPTRSVKFIPVMRARTNIPMNHRIVADQPMNHRIVADQPMNHRIAFSSPSTAADQNSRDIKKNIEPGKVGEKHHHDERNIEAESQSTISFCEQQELCDEQQDPFVRTTELTEKNILIWESPIMSQGRQGFDQNSLLQPSSKRLAQRSELFKYLQQGRDNFARSSCMYTNCHLRFDTGSSDDYTKYDVIAFFPHEMVPDKMKYSEYCRQQHRKRWSFRNQKKDSACLRFTIPAERSPSQKYVYVSAEPADISNSDSDMLTENFFNWTWTYRFDSDLVLQPFIIRDEYNQIIGPRENMTWMPSSKMSPINKDLQKIIREKTKAVVMFAEECDPPAKDYVFALRKALEDRNLTLDIFGPCFELECSPKLQNNCDELISNIISREYFFYLAFENNCNEDFVNGKHLLRALQHNAVPIVHGCANYSRFLPDLSYVDATKVPPHELAKLIDAAIYNMTDYESYFKWRNHYSYQRTDENPNSDVLCQICELVNDESKMKNHTQYENILKYAGRMSQPTQLTATSRAPASRAPGLIWNTWRNILRAPVWRYLYIFY